MEKDFFSTPLTLVNLDDHGEKIELFFLSINGHRFP